VRVYRELESNGKRVRKISRHQGIEHDLPRGQGKKKPGLGFSENYSSAKGKKAGWGGRFGGEIRGKEGEKNTSFIPPGECHENRRKRIGGLNGHRKEAKKKTGKFLSFRAGAQKANCCRKTAKGGGNQKIQLGGTTKRRKPTLVRSDKRRKD